MDWIQGAIAISTFLAVVVALFGDWLRSKLFSPELNISIHNPKGELTTMILEHPQNGEIKTRNAKARYYHLAVSNAKKWPIANETRVNLIRIATPGPDGEFQTQWVGEVPLRWKHQEINQLQRRLGPTCYCDLVYVVENKWLELTPILNPNNMPVKFTKKASIKLSVQAVSLEIESEVIDIKVSWDGQWVEGEAEMANHLIVKEDSFA